MKPARQREPPSAPFDGAARRVLRCAVMLVIPAIDIRRGRCVRLRQGRAEQETVYGDDPVALAVRWRDEGARFLHVVDLDGAFEGRPVHLHLVREIVRAVPECGVEVGGGLRDDAAVAGCLDAGVSRVIVGTRALQDPDWLRRLCEEHPGRICAGVDAEGGRVAVKGWREQSRTTALDLATRLRGIGLRAIIYTDISRDGTLEGPNLEATRAFALAADAPVIASGGIGTLEHVRAVARLPVEGLIIGRALYSGDVRLADALRAAET